MFYLHKKSIIAHGGRGRERRRETGEESTSIASLKAHRYFPVVPVTNNGNGC
jgi:hypothetical protein